MEPTLFSFIWKHSKRQQLFLLLMTLISFPFLYASLELPKRIINDAIGSTTANVTVLGFELTQTQFLMVLCLAFLATVIAAGMMKMRINTMKGVLAERLLRRLRFQLISRMLRFPKPYFRSTSQGELVSMITSEAEPMGGLMGDAVAQPAFQFGQMMTIVTFLFMQSVWFGLASVALIPLQAWLIPKLQRQINLLNKDRIQHIRHLSSEIGESAAGISDLRANGGWRYRLAMFTDRLGRLFDIRFRIYQKKFFMKFLNNLITQMTPFLFYSVGGYLAIKGEISVGALVAALGAYKDLSSPWRDLLTYYNQVQDMSLRWEIVTERFAPRGMIPESLFKGDPGDIPHLNGDIEIKDVTVHDQDGNLVLEDINLKIPDGARVAIQSSRASERAAIAELLTRETLPSSGSVTIAGRPINEFHQQVLATRIGYAHSRPYLFDGTLGDNLLMPLMAKPLEHSPPDRRLHEALRSGNSPDPLHVNWVNPELAGLQSRNEIRDWWFKLVEAMGIDEFMFRRMLRSRLDMGKHAALIRDIVALRPQVWDALKEKGLDEAIHRFDPDEFNPSIPLGGNLLFATVARDVDWQQIVADGKFIQVLHDHGLAEEGLNISQVVVNSLRQTFGRDGIDHPLFRKLGIDPDIYLRLVDIAEKRSSHGQASLTREENDILLTVPFLLSAEQIGPSFPEKYKEEILEIRKTKGAQLLEESGGLFVEVTPETYLPRLTIVENAIFGRISAIAGARAEEIEDVVAEIVNAKGLRQRVASVIYDLPTGLGGTNLPTVFQERAAFTRAGIKRPDVLILDKALASHDSESRMRTRQKLRELLPQTTILFMEDKFEHPEAYDLFVEIENGRIDGVVRRGIDGIGEGGSADLSRKLEIIASTAMFSRIDPRNQRLLAFSSQWYEAEPGQIIFRHSQPADAAYLCVAGRAELRWPEGKEEESAVSVVEPGRLIGDLSIITREKRQLDLVAVEESSFLRIGAEEFRAVIDSDASVALQLLETVAGHLAGAGEVLRLMQAQGARLPSPETSRTSLDKILGELDG